MKKQSLFLNNFNFILQLAFVNIFSIISVIIIYLFIGKNNSIYGISYFIYLLISCFFQLVWACITINIVDDYNLSGYYNAKNSFFNLGRKLSIGVGLILWLLLLVSSKSFITLLFSNLHNSFLIDNTARYINNIAFSFIIIPILNFYRGYLYSYKLNKYVFISQILEQITVIISIFVVGMLNPNAINMSFMIGSFIAYLYLLYVFIKKRKVLNKKTLKVKEPNITDKSLLNIIYNNIISYIIIYLLIFVFYFTDIYMAYNFIISKSNDSLNQIISTIDVLSVWGFELNLLFLGIIFFILFLMLRRFEFDKNSLVKNIPVILSKILFILLPLSLILFILSSSIWKIFFDYDIFSMRIYHCYILVIPFFILFLLSILLLDYLQEFKLKYRLIIGGSIIKLCLNMIFIYTCYSMKFPACYGNIIASILSFFIIVYFCLSRLGKKYKINYEFCIKKIINTFIVSLFDSVVLLIINYFLPFTLNNRVGNLVYVVIFSVLGVLIYYFLSLKMGIYNEIVNDDSIYLN